MSIDNNNNLLAKTRRTNTQTPHPLHSTPADNKTHPSTDPIHRRGCSCFSIIAFGLFFLLALAILGLLGVERYMKKKAIKDLKPAEVEEFQRWAESDMNIPPAALTSKPELPAALLKERALVFQEGKREYERWEKPLFQGSPSIVELMRSGSTLTTGQLETLTSTTATFPPLLARAKALFSNPDYVINSRTYPATGNVLFLEYTLMLRVLNAYALMQTYTGDFAGAVDTTDVVLIQSKRDPAPGFIYTVMGYEGGRHAAHLATLFQRNTSDPEHLQSLLDVLNQRREQAYQSGEPYTYMGEYLPLLAQMQADGYTSPTKITPGLLMDTGIFAERDYMEWLDENLPAGSPRRTGVRRRLAEFRSATPTGKFDWQEAITRSPLRFAVRRLERASVDVFLADYWSSVKTFMTNWASSRRNYDLARLGLARRIAELNGEPVPVTPEDFVPKYLPEYPVDAQTSKPLAVPPPSTFSSDPETTGTADSRL